MKDLKWFLILSAFVISLTASIIIYARYSSEWEEQSMKVNVPQIKLKGTMSVVVRCVGNQPEVKTFKLLVDTPVPEVLKEKK